MPDAIYNLGETAQVQLSAHVEMYMSSSATGEPICSRYRTPRFGKFGSQPSEGRLVTGEACSYGSENIPDLNKMGFTPFLPVMAWYVKISLQMIR